MRRGFTILELLVASLLLGMMMSILTMIFNQSSIAWKTGKKVAADGSEARGKIAVLRHKADNAYIVDVNGTPKVKCIRSLFNDGGTLICEQDASGGGSPGRLLADFPSMGVYDVSLDVGNADKINDSVGLSSSMSMGGTESADSYIVNVRSWGPDRKKDTRYDNIYSIPLIYDTSKW